MSLEYSLIGSPEMTETQKSNGSGAAKLAEPRILCRSLGETSGFGRGGGQSSCLINTAVSRVAACVAGRGRRGELAGLNEWCRLVHFLGWAKSPSNKRLT
jgi:hypothetical protein